MNPEDVVQHPQISRRTAVQVGALGLLGLGTNHVGALRARAAERDGTVVGASDKIGGYPSVDPQTPENMAARIYEALGLPRTVAWKDSLDRPHHVYYGEPIRGLT